MDKRQQKQQKSIYMGKKRLRKLRNLNLANLACCGDQNRPRLVDNGGINSLL